LLTAVWPHRRCCLPKTIENIDRTPDIPYGPGQVSHPFSWGDSGPRPIHGFLWGLTRVHAPDGMSICSVDIAQLRRVLNAVASGTRKFDRGLGQILHDQLHWLDVPDRVLFKLAVTVHQCLNGRAPPYPSEHCIPVSSADTRRHLRSANRHLLAVSRFRLNTYGRRAFSVAGPMAWNSLPDFIRDPTNSTDCFRRLLKT